MRRTSFPLSFSSVALLAIATPAVPSLAAVPYSDLYTLGKPAGFTSAGPAGSEFAAGGQIAGFGSGPGTGGNAHALLWNNNGTPTDLHPASGFLDSLAYGVGGGQEVGYGDSNSTAGSGPHALLWNAANPAIDLHPASGFTSSTAYGVGGGHQVGYGTDTVTGNSHALLWSGTNVATDLHPASGFYSFSVAYGVAGGQQVGSGGVTGTVNIHALLWNGTNGMTDLHPASGFTDSFAYGIGDGQEVGYGETASVHSHALLWNATNAAVDLHPAGGEFTDSFVNGVGGGQQVGYGISAADGLGHALYWTGSAASFIDLSAALPASFASSFALSVSGNTVYGLAYDTGGNAHAIAWTVPEPTGLCGLAFAAALLARRRQRP